MASSARAAPPDADLGTDRVYLCGFDSHHSSEALPGALPVGQNSPQRCPYNLVAEQLSGSSFTIPRAKNKRAWLYRIVPSTVLGAFHAVPDAYPEARFTSAGSHVTAAARRWLPLDAPASGAAAGGHTFLDGLVAVCGAGSPEEKHGCVVYFYTASAPMLRTAFASADGELLIVPQHGTLDIQTEFGWLRAPPGHIAVIPRGVRFRIVPRAGAAPLSSAGASGGPAGVAPARGYMVEVFDAPFILPDLGPIGANGLANPRDFEYPTAAYDASVAGAVRALRAGAAPPAQWQVVHKLAGEFFLARAPVSPFSVVAWHGNYAPYRYDLARFIAINSVTKDHIDPSIFTVLTCPSAIYGQAVCDFVVFPPRWAVAEQTFRPPYFHRNLMSEFMGLVHGRYEAKSGGGKQGFLPGGASLHPCMTPHGPETPVYSAAARAPLSPVRVQTEGLAFMFESHLTFRTTSTSPRLTAAVDTTYVADAWLGFPTAIPDDLVFAPPHDTTDTG